MGRKNRRSKEEPFYNEDLLREFEHTEEMRKLKIDGPKAELKITHIEPITENQKRVFEEYDQGQHLVLHGVAGSGKSFITIYLALCDVLERKYKKIILVRSAVATRDVGHLPGTLEEKTEVFQLPYVDMCRKLFGNDDAYIRLKKRGFIDFVITSYVRGLTFDDSIVLVDEASNLSFHELDSIMTRVGQNCRIIFCGDYAQTDLKGREKDGYIYFMSILSNLAKFSRIEFNKDDIVRSSIVKDYIIARDRL